MSHSAPGPLVVAMGLLWLAVLVVGIVWMVNLMRRWRATGRATDLVCAIALLVAMSYGWLLGILFAHMFTVPSAADRLVMFRAFQPILEVTGVLAGLSTIIFIALQGYDLWQLIAHRASTRRS